MQNPKIAAIASQLMLKIKVHPESRPKQQCSNPKIRCDSMTTTNADMSTVTEGSQQKKRGKTSSSNTRPSLNLKMPKQNLNVQLFNKIGKKQHQSQSSAQTQYEQDN